MFFLGSVLANVSQAQSVPVTGQNVNMVAGIGRTRNADGTYSYSLGDGDPFLTKQNDPSIAVSSLNPLHLLGGANDYRLIPLAQSVVVPGEGAGEDSWIGVYRSIDGEEAGAAQCDHWTTQFGISGVCEAALWSPVAKLTGNVCVCNTRSDAATISMSA